MHSTHLRNEHIHGVLLGTAIGEALGLARQGLPRRTALRMYGRPPLRYRFVPGRGVYGDHTRLTLLSAQALLNSRSDFRGYRHAFTTRLKWYGLSVPVGGRRAIYKSSFKSWWRDLGVKSGVNTSDSHACARAVFSALAMHGTGHRVVKWAEESTRLTHTHPLAVDACKAIAAVAAAGVAVRPGELDVHEALQQSIEVSSESELRQRLEQLQEPLRQSRSPSSVAQMLGWHMGVPDEALPVAVMAIYSFLRSPTNFRRATESAITIGGSAAALGAVAGALSGGHAGQVAIEDSLRDRVRVSPHGGEWIEAMAERFSHWPHGVDDLHLAPAQSSDPIMQLIRNVSMLPFVCLQALWRIPARLLTNVKPKRLR